MREKSAPKIGGAPQQQSASDFGHLGRKLRELFDRPPEPLPQRLLELLDLLAATDRSHPPVNKRLRDSLLSMIPNLRAFALSLCGNPEQADDLVQETLLKAWTHMDSFQEGTNLRAWLFTILRNSHLSAIRRRRREVEDSEGKKAEGLSVAPAQQGHVDMEDMRKATRAFASRSTRGASFGRSCRHVLRGGCRDCSLCSRHHQEPRQPCPHQTWQSAVRRGAGCVRPRPCAWGSDRPTHRRVVTLSWRRPASADARR